MIILAIVGVIKPSESEFRKCISTLSEGENMKIDFGEIWQLLEQNRAMLEWINEDIASVNNRIDEFTSDEAIFRGEGAKAIGSYFSEVHGYTLLAIMKCYSRFQSTFSQYVNELVRIHGTSEPDLAGGNATIVNSEYVTAYYSDLTAVCNAFSETSSEVYTLYSKYGEYFTQVQPSSTDLTNELLGGGTLVINQLTEITNLDAQFANAYYDIDDMMMGIKRVCETMTITTGYQAGSFARSEVFSLLDVSREAVELLLRSFRNSDGSLNYTAIYTLIAKGVNVLDYELAALIKLFDPGNGLSNKDVAALFNNSYTIAKGQGGVPRLLAKAFGMDAAQLAAKLSEKGRWDSLTEAEQVQLNSLLRRAQLLEFIGNLDNASQYRFDFAGFDADTNAALNYQGRDYQLSDARQLLGDNSPLALGDLATARYNDAVKDPDRISAGIDALLGSAGFYTPASVPVGVIGLSKTIISSVQSEINHCQQLENREIEFAHWRRAEATLQFGGGISYVETTSGFRGLVDNMSTQNATANMHMLTDKYHMTETQAFEIMMKKKEPYYREFLNCLTP